MEKPDYDSVAYFFRYKSVERMSDWDEQLERLSEHHPHVAKAYRDYHMHRKLFHIAMEHMLENLQDERESED